MLQNSNEEREIMEVYEKWRHAFIRGDIETCCAYLGEDYRYSGSANSETFSTKANTIELMKAAADQLKGLTDFKNNKRTVEHSGDLCFITEIFSTDILSEDNRNNKGRFRLSSVMQRKPDGWRFIFQHILTPDAEAENSETIDYGQLSEENSLLREAIHRRTTELERRNRELEIAGSLEKVRAVAIGMEESKQLTEVVSVMFRELDALNISQIACELIICDKEKEDLHFWSASAKDAYSTRSYHVSRYIHPNLEKQWQAWSNAQDRFILVLSGKGKQEWDDFILEKTAFSNYPDEVKTQIRQRQTDVFTHAIFRYGLLESVGDIALPDEDFHVLRRFADVFEQAYTRFLDLKKAEAQAREARIEAVLERVRSRSLSMQRSEELKDVIQVVYEQFVELNIQTEHTGFILDYKARDDFNSWIADRFGSPSQITIPYFDCIYYNRFNEAKKNGIDFFATVLTLEEKNRFYEDLFQHIPGFPEESKKIIFSHPGFTISTVLLENVALYIENFSGIPYSDEENAILMRFGKVFQQAYTRFLDLQKAEAQAREAQIEAALERVRSRTMAMHKSSELNDTAELLFDQLRQLGAELQGVAFAICDENSEMVQKWTSIGVFSHSCNIEPGEKRMYEAWKNQAGLYEEVYEGERQQKYYEAFMEIPAFRQGLQKFIDSGYPIPTWQKNHAVTFKHGYLLFITTKPFNETQIFLRFGKVFEQTYTRFLDLQKAEAQAREAQIEAALERVRSRSLAMHKSDEIGGVLHAVFETLKELGIDFYTAIIILFSKDSKDITWWLESKANHLYSKILVPYADIEYLRNLFAARESGMELFSKCYINEEKRELFDHLFESTDFKDVPEEQKKFLLDAEFATISVALAKNTGIHITSYSRASFPEQDHEVLKRFAKVFEQAYTRFLDLQTAEAQARESQIEAALERVRARAMAMHESRELGDVAHELRKQLGLLGQKDLETLVIHLYDESPDFINTWAAIKPPESKADIVEAWGPVPKKGLSVIEEAMQAYESKRGDYVIINEGEKARQFFSFLEKESPVAYLAINASVHIEDQTDLRFYWSFADFAGGSLLMVTHHSPDESSRQILRRFANVFGLAYRRFADLKQAEAQAREAKIEAALEKIRSRSLAMHHSDELRDVIGVTHKMLGELNIKHHTIAIQVFNFDSKSSVFWPGNNMQDIAPKVVLPFEQAIMEADTCHRDLWEAMATGEPVINKVYTKEQKDRWFEYVFAHNDSQVINEGDRQFILNAESHTVCFFPEKNSGLFADSWDNTQYVEEDLIVLKRAARVFEQAYVRFLDLQKAEAQAKEAKIETALERVRSRTMAMHNSEDVSVATATMFIELEKLGIENFRGGILNIRENKTMDVWSVNKSADSDPSDPAGRGKTIRASGEWDMTLHPWWELLYAGWVSKDEFLYYKLTGKEKEDYIKLLDARRDYIPGGIKELPDCHIQAYYFGEGALWTFSLQPHSEDYKQVMKRFASVFSLTFRRYQDLKKAEEQAREAQIEAALERVRSRAMAMQTSDDVGNATFVMFSELYKLGIELIRCGILFIDESQTMEVWTTLSATDGQTLKIISKLDMTIHPLLKGIFKGWKKKDEIFSYHLAGDDIKAYYTAMSNAQGYSMYSQYLSLPDHFCYVYFFDEGGLYTFSHQSHNSETQQILKKFTSVFSLTFRRYQDLKKAEEQAREARTEAAMEKVRARAMAMQKPGELTEVAELLRKEMGLLGVEELETSSIYIHNESTGTTECWYAIKDIRDNEKKLLADYMTINLHDTWVGREMLRFYNSDQQQVSILMKGENRKEWINYCAEHSRLLQGYYGEVIPERTYHLLKFSNGYIGAASQGDISGESWDLLKRATAVFSLAYTRFSDLQIAEASAKEAVKQAALDRIRADIASMRNVSDLDRITPLIWNELTVLGIPFIRCGVFIMDEKEQLIHTFLSNPEGKAIAAFHLPFDTPGNLSKVLNHWKDRKMYIDHWDHNAFTEMAAILVKERAISTPAQYLESIPHGGFYLHFLPFLQGMLYVGNIIQLPDDDIKMLQSVAEAFSTAYARYEDFNKLETAKQQVEKTLADLKQAQAQLVQSEKMASLGELTAGIAHEIQNPLNFVNNFSDVSKELLEEMKDHLSMGNMQQAREIADDLIGNLEKILHHGKRADGIVKGMLQHSRTSSGQKELTDINALADEYLRLAYHGLRAKDKSFNAKFETWFDDSAGKISIIPQEIGRVILNLINNAFYAVTEKKKRNTEGYEPTVTVSTAKRNGNIEIRITDNGIGISPKILDKIFQPFFTTKPTGQGTGLGLSLAYDIVKAHGGELKVETKDGEGTAFKIVLPG